MENAHKTVTGAPCPSVTVIVWALELVLVTRIATTQEVVPVSAVLEVGTACHAGVNAVAPHAVLGATLTVLVMEVTADNVPLTGCVTAEPSTFSAVIDAIPCTVITSDDAPPAVPSARCLPAVAAP